MRKITNKAILDATNLQTNLLDCNRSITDMADSSM